MSLRGFMIKNKNSHSQENKRMIKQAAAARIGWNAGQELWLLGGGILRFLAIIFCVFCVIPFFYGFYMVIDASSFQSWRGTSYLPPRELGLVFIAVGSFVGFLFYLLYLLVRAIVRRAYNENQN